MCTYTFWAISSRSKYHLSVCFREFFAKRGGRKSLFIVQCDSSDQTLSLIPCARHLLLEECRKTEEELDEFSTSTSHILMIVQLGRVAGGTPNFVGVQGEGWMSAHIDDLCPAVEEVPPIEALTNRSISEIFRSALNKSEQSLNVNKLLISCVQAAACRIEDDATTLDRATRRIEILLQLLSSEAQNRHGKKPNCYSTQPINKLPSPLGTYDHLFNRSLTLHMLIVRTGLIIRVFVYVALFSVAPVHIHQIKQVC